MCCCWISDCCFFLSFLPADIDEKYQCSYWALASVEGWCRYAMSGGLAVVLWFKLQGTHNIAHNIVSHCIANSAHCRWVEWIRCQLGLFSSGATELIRSFFFPHRTWMHLETTCWIRCCCCCRPSGKRFRNLAETWPDITLELLIHY